MTDPLRLPDQGVRRVAKYQAEYRGLVQYYLLAQDVFRLGKLLWVMETLLLKTLAGKHRSTVTKVAQKQEHRRDSRRASYLPDRHRPTRSRKEPLESIGQCTTRI